VGEIRRTLPAAMPGDGDRFPLHRIQELAELVLRRSGWHGDHLRLLQNT
jgi:hypothetical protein